MLYTYECTKINGVIGKKNDTPIKILNVVLFDLNKILLNIITSIMKSIKHVHNASDCVRVCTYKCIYVHIFIHI